MYMGTCECHTFPSLSTPRAQPGPDTGRLLSEYQLTEGPAARAGLWRFALMNRIMEI